MTGPTVGVKEFTRVSRRGSALPERAPRREFLRGVLDRKGSHGDAGEFGDGRGEIGQRFGVVSRVRLHDFPARPDDRRGDAPLGRVVADDRRVGVGDDREADAPLAPEEAVVCTISKPCTTV